MRGGPGGFCRLPTPSAGLKYLASSIGSVTMGWGLCEVVTLAEITSDVGTLSVD